MVYIGKTIGLDNYEIIIANSGGMDLPEVAKLLMVIIIRCSMLACSPNRILGASKTSFDFLVLADSHVEFREVGD
jgi:hypothetical protein